MTKDHTSDGNDILDTTTDIITSYVARNKVSVDKMCETISEVYSTVHSLSRSSRALSYKELLNGGVEAQIQE